MKIVLSAHSMPNANNSHAVIVMGVFGTGKSTIGKSLAERLGCSYADAEDYHPESNIAKMGDGIALSDTDREPWLDHLRELIEEHLLNGTGIVLAYSALREIYRERLQPAEGQLKWIFLQGDRELLAARMAACTDHAIPLTLLDFQLATLEVPAPRDALWCNVADSPENITAAAHHHITTTS